MIPGLEYRFAFNLNHQLAKSIQAIIDEAVNEIRLNKSQDASGSKERFTHVTTYLNSVITPKLNKAIKLYSNLSVFVRFIDTGLSVDASMLTRIYKDKLHLAPDLKSSKFIGIGLSDKTKTSSNLFDEVRKGVDVENAKVSDLAASVINGVLTLSTSLFLSNEIYKDVDFLSEEICGIIFHELGHLYTNGVFYGQWYDRALTVRDSVKYLSENSSSSTMPEIINTVNSEIDLVPKTEQTSIIKKGILSLLNGVSTLALATIGSVFFVLSALVTVAMVAVLRTEMLKKNIYAASVSSGSNTELMKTQNNFTITERSADAFVASLGYSGAMSSGIVKLMKVNTSAPVRAGVLGFSTGQLTFLAIVKTIMLIMFPNGTRIPFGTTYDDDLLRLEMLMGNTIPALKDPNLKTQDRDIYLENISETLKAIEELKKNYWFKYDHAVFGKVLGLLNPRSTVGIIKNANLNGDYEYLQNLTGGMIRNSLYYQAAKLNALMDPDSKTMLNKRLKNCGVVGVKLFLMADRFPKEMSALISKLEYLKKLSNGHNKREEIYDSFCQQWYLSDLNHEDYNILDKFSKDLDAAETNMKAIS